MKKKDEDFMKSSKAQDMAQQMVRDQINQAKGDGKSRHATLLQLRRKGFLKSDTDKRIVESELQRNPVAENKEADRAMERKFVRRQAIMQQIAQGTKGRTRDHAANLVDWLKALKNLKKFE